MMRLAATQDALRSAGRAARTLFYRARTGLLAVLLAAVSAHALWFANALLDTHAANHAIEAFARNDDASIDAKRAPGDVLIARLHYLLRQDRRDEAQSLVDMSRSGSATPDERARLFTILANARVRRAMTLIEAGRQDDAIPEVRLAKEAYREALRLEPGYWDAKHNFDVAMRLVRDLPSGEGDAEEVPPDAPARLWTDLPGVPRGLP